MSHCIRNQRRLSHLGVWVTCNTDAFVIGQNISARGIHMYMHEIGMPYIYMLYIYIPGICIYIYIYIFIYLFIYLFIWLKKVDMVFVL